MTAVPVAPTPADERKAKAYRGVEDPRADATRVAAPMSSSGMRGTSPTIASSGSQEPDARRLIAEYEDALTAALAEPDLIRASLAFDRADRLQQRLLRLRRTRPEVTRADCASVPALSGVPPTAVYGLRPRECADGGRPSRT